jgi:hypothetical protein
MGRPLTIMKAYANLSRLALAWVQIWDSHLRMVCPRYQEGETPPNVINSQRRWPVSDTTTVKERPSSASSWDSKLLGSDLAQLIFTHTFNHHIAAFKTSPSVPFRSSIQNKSPHSSIQTKSVCNISVRHCRRTASATAAPECLMSDRSGDIQQCMITEVTPP